MQGGGPLYSFEMKQKRRRKKEKMPDPACGFSAAAARNYHVDKLILYLSEI
jgi:hypothetical protein